MKIDLHIHTKKIAKGDPETRVMNDSKQFSSILRDNNVGIASITNHYKFDIEHYNDFKSDEFILLPGVELDIEYNGKRRQVNIITSPEEASNLLEVTNQINNSSNNLLKFEDLLKFFDKDKYIIYPDHKRHNNSNSSHWESNDLIQIRKEICNAILIADVNNASTLMILKAHNFNALIGSDLRDWTKYNEDAEKLLDTQLNIKDFNTFISILKYNCNNLQNIFKNIHTKRINDFLMSGTEYTIRNLIIKSGVNIIFGSKKTGKTEMLKEIQRQIGVERSISYFSDEGPSTNLDKIKYELAKEISNKDTKKIENYIGNFKSIIDPLIKYKETSFKNFHHFYMSYENKSKLLFHIPWNVKEINPDNGYNNDKYNFPNIIHNIKHLLVDFRKSQIPKAKILEWKMVTQTILEDLWREYYLERKKYWNSQLNKSISNKISAISAKFNGSLMKPKNIGLLDRYEEKSSFIQNIEKLKSIKKEYSFSLKKLSLPERGEINVKEFINFIEFGIDKNQQWICAGKLNITTKLGKINSSINKLNYRSNFIKLSEELNKMLEKQANYFYKYIKLLDKNNKENFSNGEKAHLSLFNLLDKNRDYYLLDEPDVYLGAKSISEHFLEKISYLVQQNKTIVITTHNSCVGINSIPTNYIFRKYKNGEDKCTTYIGSIWGGKFSNIEDNNDKIDFIKQIINNFEGGQKHFNFRKEIYEG